MHFIDVCKNTNKITMRRTRQSLKHDTHSSNNMLPNDNNRSPTCSNLGFDRLIKWPGYFLSFMQAL